MLKQSKTGQTISKKYAFIACQTLKQVARHVWMSVSFHNKITVMLQYVLDNLTNTKKKGEVQFLQAAKRKFTMLLKCSEHLCFSRRSRHTRFDKLGQSMKGSPDSSSISSKKCIVYHWVPQPPDIEEINTGPRWTTEIPPALLCLGGWLSLPNEKKHSQHSSSFSNQPSGLVSSQQGSASQW